MSDVKKYAGGCHCGRVRYEVTTDLAQVLECNCSMCAKAGWLLTFVPAAQFQLLSGDAGLSEYRFNKKVVQHLFCPTCGIKSFSQGKKGDGRDMVAINVRCLEGVDIGALSVTRVDGKSR